MLNLNDLSLALPDQSLIIKKLSLQIGEREVHVILGHNGSGKSTLLNWLAGIGEAKWVSGQALFNDHTLNQLTISERSRLGLHICPQNPPTISGLAHATLIKEMLVAQCINKDEIPSSSWVIQETKKLSETLGLPSGYPSRNLNEGYSGGEKKKNEILQLLLRKPKLALIDEIDSGLDQDSLIKAAGMLKELSTHTAMIIVTHSISFAKILEPHFVHIMQKGTLIKTGGAELLTANSF